MMDTLHLSPSEDLKGDGYQVLGGNHDWWPEKAVERAQRAVKHAMMNLSDAFLENIICATYGWPVIREGAVLPLRDGGETGPLHWVEARRTWTDDAMSDEWKPNGQSMLYPGSGDIVRGEAA